MKTTPTIKTVLTLLLSFPILSYGQTVLSADTSKDTYAHINSVLAPGNDAIEVPDAIHNNMRHITQKFDSQLNKDVFEFSIHVTPDNDISTTSTDRQRNEIKTYSPSPANLKGTLGEIVQYKWKFRIPVGFQPSSNFTHIHQIKAVGGDESNPIFAITLRKATSSGATSKLELNYYPPATSSATKLLNLEMAAFEGHWVEATETITYGSAATSTYDFVIKKISDNSILATYSDNTLITFRPDNTFARPKWGIYRSIATQSALRDESMLFADFSIQELPSLGVDEFENAFKNVNIFPNPVNEYLSFTESILNKLDAYKIIEPTGKVLIYEKIKMDKVDVSFLKPGSYFIQLYQGKVKAKTIQFLKK
ncbi:T9SS type A sorting domain-containing protein [Flavobacterium sp. NG2]|uniref:T9SS type A sorting domain-containing protein n=1 Tax=Flavobacterium sp. NG2 TaxID=3097547 RepID=UPI002A81CAFE|nr:T9SS type A sorting domain-containing protein [Flavobacterium sp. NG2]WPR72780.1 T9SS type A sorting domain-containing protein [Flavobacterium sp. NG2]